MRVTSQQARQIGLWRPEWLVNREGPDLVLWATLAHSSLRDKVASVQLHMASQEGEALLSAIDTQITLKCGVAGRQTARCVVDEPGLATAALRLMNAALAISPKQ